MHRKYLTTHRNLTRWQMRSHRKVLHKPQEQNPPAFLDSRESSSKWKKECSPRTTSLIHLVSNYGLTQVFRIYSSWLSRFLVSLTSSKQSQTLGGTHLCSKSLKSLNQSRVTNLSSGITASAFIFLSVIVTSDSHSCILTCIVLAKSTQSFRSSMSI